VLACSRLTARTSIAFGTQSGMFRRQHAGLI